MAAALLESAGHTIPTFLGHAAYYRSRWLCVEEDKCTRAMLIWHVDGNLVRIVYEITLIDSFQLITKNGHLAMAQGSPFCVCEVNMGDNTHDRWVR